MASSVVRKGAGRAWVVLALAAGAAACGAGGGEDAQTHEDVAVIDATNGEASTVDGGGGGDASSDVVSADRGTLDPVVPDFSLQDVNPNSPTNGMMISPQRYRGEVSAWYFATASCHECTVQFGYLNQLQRELDGMTTRRRIHIAGIADPYSEGLTNLIALMDRTIPLLQDTQAMNVAMAWNTVIRDVMILDDRALRVGYYNLTEHSLSDSNNYAQLRSMLLEVANR